MDVFWANSCRFFRLKEKGFGFLRPDDGGADVFAPLRTFEGDEDGLNEGDQVTYEIEVEERSSASSETTIFLPVLETTKPNQTKNTCGSAGTYDPVL